MDFNRAEPTCSRTNFLMSVRANKMQLFVLFTSHNTPNVHLRLDSILKLCWTFQIGLVCVPEDKFSCVVANITLTFDIQRLISTFVVRSIEGTRCSFFLHAQFLGLDSSTG